MKKNISNTLKTDQPPRRNCGEVEEAFENTEHANIKNALKRFHIEHGKMGKLTS